MRLAPGRASLRWWQRVVALCLAVWFVAVATDLPVAHACAMHGGAALTTAASGDAGGHHAGMAGMRHDGPPHAGGHHAPGGSGPEGDAPASCTCLGHCCVAAVVAPPHVAVLPGCDAGAPAAPTPGRPQHEYVAAWADFVLPFSTAPPLGVTV